MDQGGSSVLPQGQSGSQKPSVQITVDATRSLLEQLSKLSSQEIISDISTTFLHQDLLPNLSRLYGENTTTTLTHYIANEFGQFQDLVVLKTFVLSLLQTIVDTISLGQNITSQTTNTTKLVSSHQSTLLYIIGAGVIRGYLQNAMKTNTKYDEKTTKIISIEKLTDLFENKSELKIAFGAIIGHIFTSLVLLNKGHFQRSLIQSVSWFLTASPSLCTETLKILKPPGKTVVQLEKIFVLFFKANRIPISFDRYSTSWSNVLKPMLSSWYVSDVINATTPPKDSVYKIYGRFLALLRSPSDLSLPQGVTADIYNPDISQSILKAFRIRPQIVVPSIIHMLEFTGSGEIHHFEENDKKREKQIEKQLQKKNKKNLEKQKKNKKIISTEENDEEKVDDVSQKRTVIDENFASQLFSVILPEARHTDITRRDNGMKLFINFIEYLTKNNEKKHFLPIVTIICDAILGRNGQIAPSSLDQKLTFLPLISLVLNAGNKKQIQVYDDITTALMTAYTKEINQDVKIQIFKIISKFSTLYSTISPIFIKTFLNDILSIQSPDKQQDDVMKLSQLSSIFVNFIFLGDFSLSSLNYTKNASITLSNISTILSLINDQDVLLNKLIELITYTYSRPALYSSLLAFTLLYLTILNSSSNNKAKQISPQVMLIFGDNSPLLTYFTLTPNLLPAIVSTSPQNVSQSQDNNLDQYNMDALTIGYILDTIATYNTDLITQTEEILTKENDLKLIFNHSQRQTLTQSTQKTFSTYYSLFLSLTMYYTQLQTTKSSENNFFSLFLTKFFQKNSILGIWIQFVLIDLSHEPILPSFSAISVNPVPFDPLTQTQKYNFYKIYQNSQNLSLPLSPGGLITTPTNKDNVISPYTTKLFGSTLPTAQIDQTNPFFNILKISTTFPQNITSSTQFTQSYQYLSITSLLLASHPLLSIANNNSVSDLMKSVNSLSKKIQNELQTQILNFDFTTFFDSKNIANFISSIIFPDDKDDNNATSGWFFTPANINLRKIMHPTGKDLSKTILKTQNSTYIFTLNYTKMFTLLSSYHVAILNTPEWKTCLEKEPSDLYDDEQGLQIPYLVQPKTQSHGKGKVATAASTQTMSLLDLQVLNEKTIRTNISNITSIITIICTLLDYLIYENKQYSRDELLFIFYQPILNAMGGKPLGQTTSKTISTNYQEVYTIPIYKEVCLPLVTSFCYSLDSHFSEDPIHLDILQRTIKILLLTHDNRTNNLIKMVCEGIKNVDISKDQLLAQQKESIDQLFIIIDCLSMLSGTTSSLYFTPSSCSFILPILTLFIENLSIIIPAMNKTEQSTDHFQLLSPISPSTNSGSNTEDSTGNDDNDNDDDEDDEEGFYNGQVLFSKKSTNSKYARSTADAALLTALLSISQILHSHAKPAANSVNTLAASASSSTAAGQENSEKVQNIPQQVKTSNSYPCDQLLTLSLNFLNNFGSNSTISGTVLTNIPSTTAIQPEQIVTMLNDSITRLISCIDVNNNPQIKIENKTEKIEKNSSSKKDEKNENKNIQNIDKMITTDLFTTSVLSTNGLLSPVPSTRAAILSGLEKSRLLINYFAQNSPKNDDIDTSIDNKLISDDNITNLVLYTFILRFDTIEFEISNIAQKIFTKFKFVSIFNLNLLKNNKNIIDNGSDTIYSTSIRSLITLLSHKTRSIRTSTAASLPYLILSLLTKSVEIPSSQILKKDTFVNELSDLINATLFELLSSFRKEQDYTIKKQSVRESDIFVSNSHKRQSISSAILALSTLFSPKASSTPKMIIPALEQKTSNTITDHNGNDVIITPAAFDLGVVSSLILNKTNELYIPLLQKFNAVIVNTLINEEDYDAWDTAVYVGSTFIHTHSISDNIISIFSENLKNSLENSKSQAQKEGLVILLSSLSHYLTSQTEQHRLLLTSIWSTLIDTIQTTVQSTSTGPQTPIIDSVQKSVFAAMVTIASALPRDIMLSNFQSSFITAFASKLLSHRVSSIITCVAIIKALGGIFLMKETTLLQTLSSVLALNQTGEKDIKLDKKEQQKQLLQLQHYLPPQGDKNAHLFGTFTFYLYLVTFLPQQMSILIGTILPNILCFFGSDIILRDLTLTLSKSMMKCASTVLKSGAKIILPLLINGLREQSTWRTKTYTLQLLCTIVQFSSKDLSTVLPSIIPRLIELRRDSSKEVSTEAANVLNTLSAVIKNPQIKKISSIIVQSLHNTNINTVTRALESLYTTIFQHYVDPVALAMVMPIVFFGLTNDRSSDLKKVALQISGSVSMITSNLTDIAPYMSRLLTLMQITLMDSTPETRNVTAKAITTMVKTQQRSIAEKMIQFAPTNTGNQQAPGEGEEVNGNADDGEIIDQNPALTQAYQQDPLLQQFDELLTLLFDILSLKHVIIPSPGINTLHANDGTTSVQRSGCCYGISQILTTKHIKTVDYYYENIILPRLSDKDNIVREGYAEVMLHIPQIFGKNFAPLVVKTLPIIVGLLGDNHARVRDFAQQSSQVLVSGFAITQTAELLATILEALLDKDFRVRTGSTVLAACLILRLAGIEGDLTIAEAEDEAITAGQIQGTIKQKTAITTEKQELGMLEYISVENRNEIYSSLFLMRSDYVPSVATVAGRVWNALTPSSTRMLANILPRLVERITTDLASFDSSRQHTAGKSLSGLVSKLGDRILRDIIPILLEKFDSPDIYTRSGVCLGFAEIFAASTKSMLSPYNPDIYPVLHKGLCDRDDLVRKSARSAFATYCRALGSDKVTKEIMPLLLQTIDTYHDRYTQLKAEYGQTTPDWDNVTEEDIERYRSFTTHELYDPSADALDGLKLIVSIQQSQKFCLDHAIPHFLSSPITQFHVGGIASITSVCGKAFNSYLEQVLQSLSQTLSTLYNKFYFENDFTNINDSIEMDYDELIPLIQRQNDYNLRKQLHEERLDLYSSLQSQEIELSNNAYNVFIGLAPANYFDILDLLIIGTGNSNYGTLWDSCAWLKLMQSYWSAITKLNGMSLNPNQPSPKSQYNSGYDPSDAIPLEEYGINFQQAQLTIISFFNHDEEPILRLASDALQALLSSDHADELLKHLTYIRTQFNELSGKSRRTGLRTILELPVFNHGLLTSTLISIAQHGLVSNVAQPTIRTQCSALVLDIVDLTPSSGVGSFAMRLTGFLIRIFADKITIDIKSNILTTIALLLKKASKTLKPFHSQLRTTLVKALLTVDAEAEAAAKAIYNASGKEIASAVDNRNVIQGQDIIAERSSHALSFLSKPETFFGDLINAVLLHQHRVVAGKIAKAITQIVSDRNRSDSIPKAIILDNIHKLLPTLTSTDAHDLVRIEVSRIIGTMVSIVPLIDAYTIIATLTASVGVPTPSFPQELIDQGLEPPSNLPSPITETPHWITKQSTAMVLSSVLMTSPQMFPQCIGYRPAVAFIARGFKDDNELSLTATVRFAGRVLRFANDKGDMQIVKMLVQELLSLTSTTKCPTEAVLTCVLSQVRTFAESDAESANELINVIVPLCIRARLGAVKIVRKEIDIILYYTLLFCENEQTGFENAKNISEKFSKNEASEFMEIFKRSVVKAVEKKKTDEEIAEEEYMNGSIGKW